MAHNAELERLCNIERAKRDAAWGNALAAALSHERLTVCDPQIDPGPDGFPYFGLALEDGDDTTSFADILHVCTEQAHCGLVLFPDAKRTGEPEWVFSLGDLWSLRMFDSIEGDPVDIADSESEPETPDESREILLAAPSESFLPDAMKRALCNFVREILDLPEDPDIALAMAPNWKPMRNLMLTVQASAFRDDAHREAILGALGWFLPRHRGLLLWREGEAEGNTAERP